jgi:hypothetical protein
VTKKEQIEITSRVSDDVIAGDDGDTDQLADLPGNRDIEARFGAVGVHGGEQDLSRAAIAPRSAVSLAQSGALMPVSTQPTFSSA